MAFAWEIFGVQPPPEAVGSNDRLGLNSATRQQFRAPKQEPSDERRSYTLAPVCRDEHQRSCASVKGQAAVYAYMTLSMRAPSLVTLLRRTPSLVKPTFSRTRMDAGFQAKTGA